MCLPVGLDCVHLRKAAKEESALNAGGGGGSSYMFPGADESGDGRRQFGLSLRKPRLRRLIRGVLATGVLPLNTLLARTETPAAGRLDLRDDGRDEGVRLGGRHRRAVTRGRPGACAAIRGDAAEHIGHRPDVHVVGSSCARGRLDASNGHRNGRSVLCGSLVAGRLPGVDEESKLATPVNACSPHRSLRACSDEGTRSVPASSYRAAAGRQAGPTSITSPGSPPTSCRTLAG